MIADAELWCVSNPGYIVTIEYSDVEGTNIGKIIFSMRKKGLAETVRRYYGIVKSSIGPYITPLTISLYDDLNEMKDDLDWSDGKEKHET